MILAAITIETPETVNTVFGFFAKGGLFMWPLLACSIVSVTIMILRGLALRRKNVMPPLIENEMERLTPGESPERLSRIVHHEIAMTLRSLFVLQNTIHWIKSITIEDRNGDLKSHGHFKPINSKRFLNDCHEYIFHFAKCRQIEIDRLALGVPYQDKSNIARWSHTRGSDLRCRGNTWFIPYETIQSREKERPHPATFPVQLAQWCVKLHGVSRVRQTEFWLRNGATLKPRSTRQLRAR